MRLLKACAVLLGFALASGCGGGGDGGAGSLALVPPVPATPVTGGTADPAPTIPVTTPPEPEDPSVVTRFTATVPFGEKGGYLSSEQVVYGFGTTAVSDARYKDVIYTVPLQGTVRYPAGPAGTPSRSKVQPSASGGHPVVVFLHGMHDASDLNNAKGYDYLQKSLAENQLLMTTLDLLRAGNATGLFNGVAMPELKGKLDLERVGIVGHSRGAEAVAYAVELNKQRIGISYQDVETARRSRELVALAKAE
ncbi:MAG: hypothetical protein ACT6SC_16275, partial [Blastomonas fulva]